MPNSLVSVAATSTTVLAANTARNYILLHNDSDTTMYLNFSGADATTNDFKLEAGDRYELGNAWLNMTRDKIAAIHGGVGSKTLRVKYR